MNCPKCGSNNVNVQMVNEGAKTKHNGRGCLWECGRLLLILCTAGLWLLVGRSKGKSKTKIINKKMAICQACGNTWEL